MTDYLVTGAAGFIGSKVTEMLLDSGHNVTGADNLNDAYDLRLKQWRLKQLEERPSFTFRHLDVTDRAHVQELFSSEFEAVINLAARAGVRMSVQNPWIYIDTNVTGTLNLLEACKDAGVKKFVLASTSSLYGTQNPQPWNENADTDAPISPYAASKKAAEALCYTYHHLYDIDVSVLRYFTVYGPAGRPDMSMFRFVQWIVEGRPVVLFGDGTQTRDFTYVDDIARGTIAALKPVGYEVINLGSDRPQVINNVIALIETLVEKKATVRREPADPTDLLATWADVAKAERLLDWKPEYHFEQGARNLVSWYLDNRDWARDIVTI